MHVPSAVLTLCDSLCSEYAFAWCLLYQGSVWCPRGIFFFFKILFIYFLREGKEERKRERNINV